jgi:YaiO family outer membrane protein
MKHILLKTPITLTIVLLTLCACMLAQESGRPIPQGSSGPVVGMIPTTLNGPGFIEIDGSHSALSDSQPSWNDVYLRGGMSFSSNTVNLEFSRQSRFGDSGWFYNGGWVHTWAPKWYTDVHLGTSTGSFFLPRFRVDGFVHRKVLSREQLVLNFGAGYDKSRLQASAYRITPGAAYYFDRFPLVLEGGVTWTQSNPGSVVARSQYVALTEGRAKEHYLAVRAEVGREAYEIIQGQATAFNFPIRNFAGTWRQWLAPNWGLNFNVERDGNPFYHRLGGTIGIFLDF